MAALPEDWATTLPASVLPLLFKTLVFASTKHANQRRKDPQGTPYINHPIGVAAYLVEAGVTNVSVLQAALLHDTIEDTATTAEELRSEFGDQVTAIVLECSDDTALPSAQRKLIQVEKAAQASTEAKLVKMADKLYNLRDLCRALPVGWSVERVQAYYRWAKQVTDRCAGTNACLERQLQTLYQTATFECNGQVYPCLA